ncbi:MAG: hypothetical protein R3B70_21435 [Polyangiaceae bacterium]
MSYERWTERYIDVLAEAIVRARAEGTLSLCSEPLAESMRDLALGQRSETALSMWDALVHRLWRSARRMIPSPARPDARDVRAGGDQAAAQGSVAPDAGGARGGAHVAPAEHGPRPGPNTPAPSSPGLSSTGVNCVPTAMEAAADRGAPILILELADSAAAEVAAQALPWIAHDGFGGRLPPGGAIARGREERIADVVMTFEPGGGAADPCALAASGSDAGGDGSRASRARGTRRCGARPSPTPRGQRTSCATS